MRVDVLDVRFDNVNMDEALKLAGELSAQRHRYCVTPNSEIVYEAKRNPELEEILQKADMVLPDSFGILLSAKILGTPMKEKVAGVELAENLLRLGAENGKSFYFLGGKPGVAEQAAKNMTTKYSGVKILGTADGYFQDAAPVIEEINRHRPDYLFVCLGAPKQEFFIAEHLHEIDAGLMIGLGGSVDVFAGTAKRAPKWMLRLNLEWLYRLIREPWRYKRMLDIPKFLWAVVKSRRKQD